MRSNRMRGLLLALLSSLALAAPGGAAAQVAEETDTASEVKALAESVSRYRATTWHWQRVVGKRRSPTRYMERKTTDLGHLTAIRDMWKRRATRTRARGQRPPHRAAWLCIKRYEGHWKDPHAPYWGGLQMSMQFQRAFGRYLLRKKGTANRWKPAEQMWTAEKALRAGLGFHPWPNTARRCGLL
ncbi:MAG TPA: hypothetical protein VD769_13595 [Gaiellaceae bacterium]|nr:hypothetical protein [Gaiellaceae bacterium]